MYLEGTYLTVLDRLCPFLIAFRCRYTGASGLLVWVNEQLHEDLTTMEELGDGVVFCRLLDRLFHSTFPLRKVFPPHLSNQTDDEVILTCVALFAAATWGHSGAQEA